MGKIKQNKGFFIFIFRNTTKSTKKRKKRKINGHFSSEMEKMPFHFFKNQT